MFIENASRCLALTFTENNHNILLRKQWYIIIINNNIYMSLCIRSQN
jgi:hypothetical protein